MQANKSSGTSCEVLLAKALWKKGYRYRKNNKAIIGKPDIVFEKLRIAIFIDGEFWHGKDWNIKKRKIAENKEYWIKKIEENMGRDKRVAEILEAESWTVLRFWHGEVKKHLEDCIKRIEKVISQKQGRE